MYLWKYFISYISYRYPIKFPVHSIRTDGWGMPNAGVQLGNVVVSKPSGEFGGVYDYGKINSGGILENTGMSNKPPTVLLTTISRLQAAYLQRPSQVPVMFTETLQSNSMMVTTFGYPGTSDDTIGEQKLAT